MVHLNNFRQTSSCTSPSNSGSDFKPAVRRSKTQGLAAAPTCIIVYFTKIQILLYVHIHVGSLTSKTAVRGIRSSTSSFKF